MHCTIQQADLVLTRFAYSPHGTFGSITLPSGQIVYTVEDPWRQNRPGESAIPEGFYRCVPRRYHRGDYEAIHVTDVPGRSLILFHIANNSNDVRGCIGVGNKLGFYEGLWSVLESGRASGGFAALMRHFGGKKFALEIRRYVPEAMVPTTIKFRRAA